MLYEVITTDDPTSAIAVMGDFNSVPGSDPIQALIGAPPQELSSVVAGLPPAEQYSVNFGGTPQLFDNQMIDPNMSALLDANGVTIGHGLNA